VLLLCAAAACGGGAKKKKKAAPTAPPVDPVVEEAAILGRELKDIVDRVMSYKSSHRNALPNSLRQVGIDSLTPVFIRRLSRQGGEPLVTIAYRRREGHAVTLCRGTNVVLEDAMLREGKFDIVCEMSGGNIRNFVIEPPPPPPKPDDE
jgi:hypothetical protein